MAYSVHQVPGRLRIKIPTLRRNPRLAQDLKDSMERFSEIKEVSVNTVTGSMIVHHDPEAIDSNAILSFLAREKLIDLAEALPARQDSDEVFARVGHAASKALIGLVLDRTLGNSPLAVLTAFI